VHRILLTLFVAILGAVLVIPDAEARRFGGGRSLGMQRNVTPPPARPAQQQAAPAQQSGSTQQAAGAGSRWMPILGGLALGGVLGALFAGNGLGGILLLALLAIGGVLAFKALQRRQAGSPQAVEFAGLGRESVRVPPQPQAGELRGEPHVPAGFDVSGFLRGAKSSFTKLQLANDSGDLEQIRDFTTEELFDALSSELNSLGTRHQTDVMSLEAQLLELKTEGASHWASVHFSGLVRESAEAPAQPFAEVWNLVKPADGSSGWLLAGIQQMH
jgi:predicted lipid-binding transport protein (Tim44 family)